MRERTSRRHAAIPLGLFLAALVLAVSTAERAEGALPSDQRTVSVLDVMVTEGTGGSATAVFRVRLSATSADSVGVTYATADDGATAPADYAARSGSVTFAPGELEKTVNVPVVSDSLDEAHENFVLELSSASGAAVDDGRAFATIVDDDAEPTVSVLDGSATEGAAADFTVALSAPSGKLVTVEYATAPGSASGADFTASSGTLAFAAGETAKTVSVPTLADALVEGEEQFSLSLLRPANVVLAGAQATGTIRDDDAPPAGGDPGGGEGGGAPDPGPPAPPNAAPDCSGVRPSTARLWPPNHKLRLVKLSGAADPDGDPVTLAVTGVTQDEPVRGLGRGDRGPDAAWVAGRPNAVRLRAERKGRGNGRVYRVAFTATDGAGASCTGTALVGVPHDARKRWVDSGAVFDSFG